MLTIITETRDNEAELAQTLSALVAGAVEGLVSDVIVLDHASQDGSCRVADAAGARFCTSWDMTEIVRSARGDWLLLLEAGARPLGALDRRCGGVYVTEQDAGPLFAVPAISPAVPAAHRQTRCAAGTGIAAVEAAGGDDRQIHHAAR